MPALLLRLRFNSFRLIDWLSARILSNNKVPHKGQRSNATAYSHSDRFLWVYASTIGELHAIEPLVKILLQQLDAQLVVLTDHIHYEESLLKAFPAAVVVDHGEQGKIVDEINAYPPVMFIVAEIPCVLHDAPCRFSYRVLYAMKKCQVKIIVVNGWLYGATPNCRIDRIESKLLGSDYLQLIDLFMVQNEQVKNTLSNVGVPDEKLVVAGNIKFDSVFSVQEIEKISNPLQLIVDQITQLNRPCIVAGCITNVSEQEYLLDAFLSLQQHIPELFLVLTPRHPENIERMIILADLLEQRNINNAWRSKDTAEAISHADVFVLDSMGELRHLYGISDVSFVGLNHNVLEPLSLDKPVFVSSGWDNAYPSYPVYQTTKQAGLIIEANDSADLSRLLLKFFSLGGLETQTSPHQHLQALSGATAINLEMINKL